MNIKIKFFFKINTEDSEFELVNKYLKELKSYLEASKSMLDNFTNILNDADELLSLEGNDLKKIIELENNCKIPDEVNLKTSFNSFLIF